MVVRDERHAQSAPVADAIAPGAVTALIARLVRPPTSEAPPPLLPGARVGRYEVLREIGHGGFGAVYEAHDTALNRLVALKVFYPTGATDPAAAREAEVAARLAHPNIAVLHDAGAVEGSFAYLVYEILHGETLESRLARGPIPPGEAVAIAMQVARALLHAHEHGVVHRDLKPSNVFLTAEGDVKVLDFGVALLFGRAAPAAGTPAYMAPEQRNGQPEDARTDLYALGVLLGEMLLGDGGDATGASDRAPSGVRRVLATLLAQEPASRPRSAHAALVELEAAARALAAPRVRRRRLAVAAVIAVAVAAATGAGVLVRERLNHGAAVTETAVPSIAVLPFADMSPQRDQEYFSDGLAEEILNALAHVEGLHVVGRTSSFSFKGKAVDVRTMAQRLSVRAVLEGSVRKAGPRVRVTAQLVDAASGYHLWSETYDRDLSDVFAVQDDIARSVVQALRVKLLPGREPTTQPHRTANPEVYNHYLLGRQHYYRNSREGFRAAVAEFEKALALDPRYAPAWAGISIPLRYAADDEPTLERAREMQRRSREAAEKAVALAPDLADGWSVRGMARTGDFDWEGGLADLEKAIALNPGDPHARRRLSILLADLGPLDEALAASLKAIELDPLSPQNWSVLGSLHLGTGRLDLARSAFTRGLERSPESCDCMFGLAVVHFLSGRHAPREALARCDDDAVRLFRTALVEQRLGHRRESQRGLDALVARYAHVRAYLIADIYAARGDVDHALEWLDRAITQRDSYLDTVRIDPLLRPVRDDPRFAALLRRVNLPAD